MDMTNEIICGQPITLYGGDYCPHTRESCPYFNFKSVAVNPSYKIELKDGEDRKMFHGCGFNSGNRFKEMGSLPVIQDKL